MKIKIEEDCVVEFGKCEVEFREGKRYEITNSKALEYVVTGILLDAVTKGVMKGL